MAEVRVVRAANGTRETLRTENILNPATNALSSGPRSFRGKTNSPKIAIRNNTAPKVPKVSVNRSGP